MTTVLVAGATGALGRHVAAALRGRGYRVRALTRTAAHGAGLAPYVDEVVVGDATQPATIAQVCAGVERVFSCLGQSVSADFANRGPGYHAIDYVGNHHLIEAARASGVQRFAYVSVYGAERFPQLAYMQAHARVAAELRSSGLGHAIICPTGFFSAFTAILDMARSGTATLFGDGSARSNPIHEADLAEVCADAVTQDQDATIEVGGPEVVTRLQIVEAAFAALGKPPKIMRVPAWSASVVAALSAPVAPRISELMAFGATMFTTDIIAPAAGTRRIADYFAALAGR
jgi:uncharacterized protein YbjT (DUF2867 family)